MVSESLKQTINQPSIPDLRSLITTATLPAFAPREVGNHTAHRIVLGSLTLNTKVEIRLPDIVAVIPVLGFLTGVGGTASESVEEFVQPPDVVRELVTLVFEETLAELEDGFLDLGRAGGLWNPAVAEQVLFEEG